MVRACAIIDGRFRPAYPEMHVFAALTLCFPACRLFESHRHVRPKCRVAHELKYQRRAGFASASVATQLHRSSVPVKSLLAGRAFRLPLARLHYSLLGVVTGTWRCTQPNGNRFPSPAMTSGRTGDGVSDLVQERVQNRLRRTVPGIIIGDLDPFRSILAHAQPPLRVRQTKRPVLQAMLRHTVDPNNWTSG